MRAIITLFLAVWRYSHGRRHILISYILMVIGANCFYLLEPLVVARVLNTIQNISTSTHPLREIVVYLMALTGLTVGFWALHGPARIMEISNAYRVTTKFLSHIFTILTSLPIGWHRQQHSGRITNRVRKASRALQDFSENTFHLIEMCVHLIGSIIALGLIMPVAAVIACFVSSLALAIVFVFDRRLIKCYDSINEHEHTTAAAIHDFISNIFTVISLRLESIARAEVYKRASCYSDLVKRTAVTQELKWFLATLTVSLMTITVLAWYTISTLNAGINPMAGTLFMLYDYLQKIGASFYMFALAYSKTMQQYADLRAVDVIFQAEPVQLDESIRLPHGWKDVHIEHLNFTYEDKEHHKHHLKDVQLSIKRSQKIAFVGPSGSGKSTLLALLRGLQTTYDVRVTCDGYLLAHGLRHLAPHITLIPQTPEVFAGTVQYNICAHEQVCESEVMQAIELAQFTSVLQQLPNGLQTNIGENGVSLSGGQMQRLALARGIFTAKGSDIILLDEPTSAVDSQNELKIYQNLFTYFSNRCIISSIHRLHLLALFDEIYVMDNGQVIEHGSFQELLQRQGLLFNLWQAYYAETHQQSPIPQTS